MRRSRGSTQILLILTSPVILGVFPACQISPKAVLPGVTLALVNGVLVDGTDAEPILEAALLIYIE